MTTQAELIAAVAKDAGVSQADAGRMLDALVKNIHKSLIGGGDVRISNLGVFDTAELEARVAADPNDHQARFDLAEAQSAAGDFKGAVDNASGIAVLTEVAKRLGRPVEIQDMGFQALFAASARAMVERGDWLIPHVNGLPRYDKPPLVYWLMGLLYALPGQEHWNPLGTWASALPSALACVAVITLDTAVGVSSSNRTLSVPGATLGSLSWSVIW